MSHFSDSLARFTPACLPLLIACAASRQPAAEALAILAPAATSAATAPVPAPVPVAQPAPAAEPPATAESPAEPATLSDESPAVPVVPRADALEAIHVSNEGDRFVKVNVEDAIQKYRRACELDPSNARILYKLVQAYEKKEDWERMASALATAVTLAPGEALYHFKRGVALVKLAEAGDPARYEEAKAPLRRCLELEPARAECHFYLGVAAEYTLDDQAALQSYTRAIENSPEVSYFYPPLAALYIVHKRYRDAAQTLAEGARRIAPTEANAESLYAIYLLQSHVAQAEGDPRAMLDAMEQAQSFAADAHPEIAFNLGATYAAQEPPQKEKAIRLLTSFTKRACRSARAARYREQCEAARALLQALGAP